MALVQGDMSTVRDFLSCFIDDRLRYPTQYCPTADELERQLETIANIRDAVTFGFPWDGLVHGTYRKYLQRLGTGPLSYVSYLRSHNGHLTEDIVLVRLCDLWGQFERFWRNHLQNSNCRDAKSLRAYYVSWFENEGLTREADSH
jgi:hypothetical protein